MQFPRANRLFQILVTVCVTLLFTYAGRAQEEDEKKLIDDFRLMVEKTILSCETLVIVDYKVSDKAFSFEKMGPSQPVKFDVAACKKMLREEKFGKALGPYWDSMANAFKDPGPSDHPLSEDELKSLNKERDAADLKVAKAVKSELDSFVGYCRVVEPKPLKGMARVCYFGAYTSKSDAPARAVFDAMAHDRLGSEALCAADPIDRKEQPLPEFASFLEPKDQLTSWKSIRKSLVSDGFSCTKGKDYDGCKRWILAVHLGDENSKATEAKDGLYGHDFITPRELVVYKGRWYIPGPFGRPASDCKKKPCPAGPLRGSSEGICMAPEDWHIFIYIPMMLNSPLEPE